MKKIASGIAGSFIALLVSVSAPAAAESLEFEGNTWTFEPGKNGVVRADSFEGRDALYLHGVTATLDGPDLRDAVIEYEYASSHPSGFIGVDFRSDEETGNLEQFYTRPHQSGHPDATQYMVAINGVATWQLHAGPNDATAIDLAAREWIKVKIVAIGDRADIFVGDMTTPLLHVADLRSDEGRGKTALFASDRFWIKDTGAYFSNVSVRPANRNDKIVGTSRETEDLPEGLISQFDVSSPFAEADIQSQFALSNEMSSSAWTKLAVENDGVANLARVSPIADGKNTALVRFRISSEEATQRVLTFGYSDRVRLYVNGKLAYSGNAVWRARDHRFLGTVALADSIPLFLEEGETEIIAAVSESFGGWGFKAQIEDQAGLSILTDAN